MMHGQTKIKFKKIILTVTAVFLLKIPHFDICGISYNTHFGLMIVNNTQKNFEMNL